MFFFPLQIGLAIETPCLTVTHGSTHRRLATDEGQQRGATSVADQGPSTFGTIKIGDKFNVGTSLSVFYMSNKVYCDSIFDLLSP